MTGIAFLWFVGQLAGQAATRPAEDEAARLLERLQERYESTRTLRLEFTQRYTNRATGRTMVETGVIVTSKPGKMRWQYHDSDKLFVLRDGVSWFYVPDEQVAYRMTTSAEDARRMPALMLAGTADLRRDFRATLEDGDGDLRLKLVPLHGGASLEDDYEYLLLRLERTTLALRSIGVVDVLGNLTEYEFRNEQRDVSVADSAFDFAPPRDVEVVEAR